MLDPEAALAATAERFGAMTAGRRSRRASGEGRGDERDEERGTEEASKLRSADLTWWCTVPDLTFLDFTLAVNLAAKIFCKVFFLYLTSKYVILGLQQNVIHKEIRFHIITRQMLF